MSNYYKHGEWNAICDVCGKEYKSSSLRKRWDGFMVCHKDWEERHPMDSMKAHPEHTKVPWVRDDSTEAGGTDISGNVFPIALNPATATAVPTPTDFGNDDL